MQDYRFLKFEGDEIAVWILSDDPSEHSSYYPQSILSYLKRGTLYLREADKKYRVDAPAYFLLRKNTLGYLSKTWTPSEGNSEMLAIRLYDAYIMEAITAIVPPESYGKTTFSPISRLEENDTIRSLFESLEAYYEKQQVIDEEVLRNGMLLAIQGCIDAEPALYSLFKNLANPIRVHLRKIVDHHYNLGYNVEEMADLVGISLSTFYREFRKEFGEPPHTWIMKRRLQLAYDLLSTTEKSVSEVSDEAGFQTLAHFSKRFKKHFGVAPSTISGN